MGSLKQILKTVTPGFVRRYLRKLHRDYKFSQAMKKFVSDPQSVIATQRTVISDLIYGWGNEDWSALDEYLLGCLDQAWVCEGAVLECGSGLTTLILGVILQTKGQHLWSLEHNPVWGDRVKKNLKRFGIDSVQLCIAPLKDYGAFSWYDPPLNAMPEKFDLVVCDGPPSDTPGGRYGLLPVMKTKLQPGTTILLDDAAREQERAIATRWTNELGAASEVLGIKKPYLRISIPIGVV
ncbi:class I SAM-dependent methyltransferase [Kovacikia minuta CCNUW1]|uniref:class I SAM-dependent methyltransferase n=1 Tax=Kovacikia minuta TaxID=2931930 RepID=UPI001CCD36B7|nr:class I SAM-dependent methyltransferase [Kovacikia minuta]UBF27630.1 class I SAM-dependent methyltransferase [Kovacikia minuta CCNUW1]